MSSARRSRTSLTRSALARLRSALGEVGLHIVLPLSQAGLDRAGLDLRLGQLLAGAGGALVVGDGGGAFFAGFQTDRSLADRDGATDDPLDRYTARIVRQVVTQTLASQDFHLAFPFAKEPPWLPFQRLGQAAGLPPPGPLGVQVHPRYGPWWGYRALIVVRDPLADEPPLSAPCDGCAAPCATACPVDALAGLRLDIDRCAGHRLDGAPACQHHCAARAACICGPEHRYPADQLTFHMAASLRSIRRHYRR
jgi:epoxyqueuosine reductase